MKGVSSRENRRLAAERKKALFQQVLQNQQTKREALQRASGQVEAATQPIPIEPSAQPAATEESPRVRCTGDAMRFLQDHAEEPLLPSTPLRRLVDLYLDAAADRTAHLVLMWPVAPQVLPLVHVLATMECWQAGGKAGLRGLFYPAKENSFHQLNHLELDRDDLRRHTRAFFDDRSVPDKDPVFSCAVNTPEVLPSVNDLLPHFTRLKRGDEWRSYEGRLLERTLKRVNRYLAKAALRGNCSGLGAPDKAPDALFALGYQLDRETLLEAFKSLKRIGLPDVCLVNATRALRYTVPTWHTQLKQFFGAFLRAFPLTRPGLVVVTDDPGVGYRIHELVKAEFERATKHHPDSTPLTLRFDAIACQDGGELGQCLQPLGTSEPKAPDPRKYRVEIKDADAARVVRTLYQVRHDLKLDDDAAAPLNDAAAFLHKLAGVPAGYRDIEAWLDEREADAALRRRFSWSSPRGGLVEFITRGNAKACERRLEEVIKAGDRLAADYFEATPMALAMAREVGAALGAATRVALVFTRPMQRLLAERYLSRQTYSDGRPFSSLEGHLQLITTKQLREHARSHWATRYVFVGIDDEALRLLMTEDGIPADSLLLLTQRTALYTRWTLKPIYEQAEFRRFKPRLEHVLRQLNDQLAGPDIPMLRFDDFVLPTFDFSSAPGSREDDPEAWRIVVEGGASLYRSGTTTVYIYDPVADTSSKSGFTAKEVQSLEPGDQLFVMSADLRDQVEDALQRAGMPIEHDKPFEQTLRRYHASVTRNLNQSFPGKALANRVAALKEAIQKETPEVANDLANIRHWVSLGHAPNTPFEVLRPQAPRHYKVFAAFMAALGFSESESEYFWQAAIHPIRVNRRLDGRYVTDVYSRILFDPESAIVHAKLSASDIATLFAEARRNVHTVAAIETPASAKEAA